MSCIHTEERGTGTAGAWSCECFGMRSVPGVRGARQSSASPAVPQGAKGPLADADPAFLLPARQRAALRSPLVALPPREEIAGLIPFKAHLKTSDQNKAGAFLSFYSVGFGSIQRGSWANE